MSDAPVPLPPLADVQWTFRRIFAFSLALIGNAHLAAIIYLCRHDARALLWLGLALIALNALVAVLYMAGATATDIARIGGAVKVNLPGSVSLQGLGGTVDGPPAGGAS